MLPVAWPELAPEPDLPRIRCEDPAEYAHGVLAERHPALLRQVRACHPYGPERHAALDALEREITAGPVGALPADAAADAVDAAGDAQAWQAWVEPYLGGSWFAMPFLVAEAYFYRRLLEATGYTGGGVWHGVDPFAPAKAAELAQAGAATATTAPAGAPGLDDLVLDDLVLDDLVLDDLVLAAVWGNQADLGFLLDHGGRDAPGATGDLLVDDTARLRPALADAGAGEGTVLYVADNAGRELIADLLLIDRLLSGGLAGAVALHVKPVPTFVSDATAADVVAALGALAGRGDAGRSAADRLRDAARRGALAVRTHWFWTAPFSFHHLPPDLVAEVRSAAFVLLKGDLNYRRLLGDLWWPPTAGFEAATAYLPAPVAALRTLKSDVVAGLPTALAHRLETDEPGWRTSGRHAVVQVGGNHHRPDSTDGAIIGA